ncbi:hypothetical protein [Haloarcula sediminis]|uniref:hypothetical protein n=1 Tax=Haloarcula sediminis TaxID=3111777 RepID=UPI002D797880|nr:hypothetical protein [Haloarcula sp. CK38]
MGGTPNTRKASLERAWEPLTDEHERQLRRAEETFEHFENGQSVDPLALVGAYRSGKTQLLYHLFRRSWERGIPAFYIGDPGAMLTEFASTDETDLNTWLQSRIDEQLAAYADDEVTGVAWFPNVDSDSKREFVESHGTDIDSSTSVRTALFFDEVEQSYREFIRVMDKDDDNPLRKINDGLQDSVKVWSFGMISAFEFIGEADWGRMREVRIPPLGVADVRSLLAEDHRDATELANVLWWLARGRTGLIIKLVDNLPEGGPDAVIRWLRDLAETNFRETKLLNNIWTDCDREQWDRAIRALMFDEAGLDAWQLSQQKSLTATQCQYIAVDILDETFDGAADEHHKDALEIADRNIERVFRGLSVTDEFLFPAFGLADEEQADAFLSLVTDTITSFEPASDARSTAIEGLDGVSGVFHTRWIDHVSDTDTVDEAVSTAAPSIVHSAFPPIAVNPERVSDRTTEAIRSSMDRGLTIHPDGEATATAEIRLCPTEDAFQTAVGDITTSYDLTAPTILLVPEGREFDHDATGLDVYRRHQLAAIESYQSSRFWTFVTHLHGRLADKGVADPYAVDDETVAELVANCDDREVRNTIETLYDQLRQVASDHLGGFERRYRETYSLPDAETLLWEESRLAGASPYWSSGKFVESTVTLSYLLLFGPEYEADRAYTDLHESFVDGLDHDLVAADRDGFQFKTYLDSLFTQSGYSKAVLAEREHYTDGDQVALPVRRTQEALADLAGLADTADIIAKLDDPETSLQDTHVPVVGLDGNTYLGHALVRSLLVAGLTTGPNADIDMLDRLRQTKSEVDSALETVTHCLDDIESYGRRLRPPTRATVGQWVTIEADRIERYQANLKQVRNGLDDLIAKVESTPSAGPIAYHYWFLLRIYLRDMARQLETVETTVTETDIAAITDAVELFDDVHATLETADFVDSVFDDRAALVAQLEEFGDDLFDLRGALRQTTVSSANGDGAVLSQVDEYDDQVVLSDPESASVQLKLPEDSDVLEQLNRSVAQHAQHLVKVRDELAATEATAADVDKLTRETKGALLTLVSNDDSVEVTND